MRDSRGLRKIDRSVGSLICWLISLPWIRRWLQSKENENKDVLMIELFEMGAAVMLVPSMRRLEQQGYRIHVLTTRSCQACWEELAKICPLELTVLRDGSPVEFVWSVLQTVMRLRKKSFDMVINFGLFMRVPAIICQLLRARHYAGFLKYNAEGLFRGSIHDRGCGFNQNTHISKNYLALTEAAMSAEQSLPNFKAPIDVDIDRCGFFREESKGTGNLPRAVQQLITGDPSPYVVICPDVGPNLSVRNYPKDAYVEVGKKILAEQPEKKVLVCAAPVEKESSAYITREVGEGRCIDMGGQLSFADFLRVIRHADLLIGNDNGPAHFAALYQTKVVAIFSTDSPFMYGPFGRCVLAYSYYHCSPCISAMNGKSSPCSDNQCLQAIPSDQVYGLVKAVLDDAAQYNTVNNRTSYL